MLEAIRNRKKEDGFTLIELMVVVLIIAILVAIAVPTFLGARGSSQDRAAQSDLRNALSAAKLFYADNETYAEASMTASELGDIEPSLVFSATETVVNTAGATDVGYVGNATDVTFVRRSASGAVVFSICDDTDPASSTAGTHFGTGTDAATAIADCTNSGW
ncbi:MAG: prepilin-type N-terminal cleavage/methylation domain-containing protein [Actinobacteria bacterium]|nr:prepilin-type N-terminal cleavage/methylation domain-containing protein [Actinomycetota bacterium]